MRIIGGESRDLGLGLRVWAGRDISDEVVAVDVWLYAFGLCLGCLAILDRDDEGNIVAIAASTQGSIPRTKKKVALFVLLQRMV